VGPIRSCVRPFTQHSGIVTLSAGALSTRSSPYSNGGSCRRRASRSKGSPIPLVQPYPTQASCTIWEVTTTDMACLKHCWRGAGPMRLVLPARQNGEQSRPSFSASEIAWLLEIRNRLLLANRHRVDHMFPAPRPVDRSSRQRCSDQSTATAQAGAVAATAGETSRPKSIFLAACVAG